MIDLLTDKEWCNKEFITTVQKRGAEIIKKRGLSRYNISIYNILNISGFSAAVAVKDHLKDWYFGTNNKLVSMGIISDGSYGVEEGLCFSYPVTCKNFDYEIERNLDLKEFAKEKLQITMNELKEEKSEVKLS